MYIPVVSGQTRCSILRPLARAASTRCAGRGRAPRPASPSLKRRARRGPTGLLFSGVVRFHGGNFILESTWWFDPTFCSP